MIVERILQRIATKSGGGVTFGANNRRTDPCSAADCRKCPSRCEVCKRRGELLQEAAAGLTAKLESATATMAEIMEDGQNPASVRVSAADAVLRHALRYVEAADILRRLDALEAAQNDE